MPAYRSFCSSSWEQRAAMKHEETERLRRERHYLNCILGCHNGKSSGVSKIPPNLAGIFERPRLPSGAPATDAAVRSTVLEGRSGIMPSFQGSLSDEQIAAIIHYLHSASPKHVVHDELSGLPFVFGSKIAFGIGRRPRRAEARLRFNDPRSQCAVAEDPAPLAVEF